MFTESETLELKSSLTADIKKEIIAFANTKGGTIYIGIDDDKKIIGVSNIHTECERLSSFIQDGIKPDIKAFLSITPIKIENKDVIKVSITRGTQRPYYLADKGMKSTGIYVRLSNTSVPIASEDSIRQMIKENDGESYESSRSLNQNLTFDEANKIFNAYQIPFETSQQKTLGIIGNDELYTNLALLISDQCVHSIKIAVFNDSSPDSFQDRREFTGSLFKQLTDTFEYINQHNQLHTSYEGLVRKEIKNYSDICIREALLNAIVHRDYAYSGSIQIRIYPQKLEFLSIGGLVFGFTLQDVLLGISQPRNPKLAALFYRLKLIEAYGTGLQKIIQDYHYTIKKPEFICSNNAFLLKLPNKFNPNSIGEEPALYQPISEKIIQLLATEGPMSRPTIQQKLNLKQTTCSNALASLVKQNLILKIGAGKNTIYKINH